VGGGATGPNVVISLDKRGKDQQKNDEGGGKQTHPVGHPAHNLKRGLGVSLGYAKNIRFAEKGEGQRTRKKKKNSLRASSTPGGGGKTNWVRKRKLNRKGTSKRSFGRRKETNRIKAHRGGGRYIT